MGILLFRRRLRLVSCEAVKRRQKHLLIPCETRVIFYPGVLSLSIPAGLLLSSPQPLPSSQSTPYLALHHSLPSSLIPPRAFRPPSSPASSLHLSNSLFNLNNFKKSSPLPHPVPAGIRFPSHVVSFPPRSPLPAPVSRPRFFSGAPRGFIRPPTLASDSLSPSCLFVVFPSFPLPRPFIPFILI